MKPGFSTINIIIILGLILLAYLGYTEYLDDQVKQILSGSVSSPRNPTAPEKPKQTAAADLTPGKQTALKEIIARPAETPEAEKTIAPASKKGYYENNAYFYQISFPEDWPIRVRSESNVSLGIVPPENGRGAITIEISQGESNELDQAKAEAKKYAGLISITEEPITLAGVSGNKITLNNLMAKTKTINLLLKKSGLNYIIKYSEESPEFVSQVDRALATFKFTR